MHWTFPFPPEKEEKAGARLTASTNVLGSVLCSRTSVSFILEAVTDSTYLVDGGSQARHFLLLQAPSDQWPQHSAYVL